MSSIKTDLLETLIIKQTKKEQKSTYEIIIMRRVVKKKLGSIMEISKKVYK